jgi:hypothetical protein
VSTAGRYEIVATGGAGGNAGGAAGGRGAQIEDAFNLDAGQTLTLVVGGRALASLGPDLGASGGGGTFVILQGGTVLLVAGGGGGASFMTPGGSATAMGGNGVGGLPGLDDNHGGAGGGGGGLRTDGGTSKVGPLNGSGGASFTNGAAGGKSFNDGRPGGYGGGGGAGALGGGGGGGFDGGHGGSQYDIGDRASQGGSSFDSGLNPRLALASPADGAVQINLLEEFSIPEPTSLVLFAAGLTGFGLLRIFDAERRARRTAFSTACWTARITAGPGERGRRKQAATCHLRPRDDIARRGPLRPGLRS